VSDPRKTVLSPSYHTDLEYRDDWDRGEEEWQFNVSRTGMQDEVTSKKSVGGSDCDFET